MLAFNVPSSSKHEKSGKTERVFSFGRRRIKNTEEHQSSTEPMSQELFRTQSSKNTKSTMSAQHVKQTTRGKPQSNSWSFMDYLFPFSPKPVSNAKPKELTKSKSRETIPERVVSCLACGSDDIPRSNSIKLKCKHRMCHSCLRRLFRLSTKDPSHMPPKCCTADVIPVSRIEDIFSARFKRLWNDKYDESKCKDPKYCYSKKCGAWIRPEDISVRPGKISKHETRNKVGKCSSCSKETCISCGDKRHGDSTCVDDEATKEVLNLGKEKGWQRCPDCGIMVILEEGCNHITCRCKAEWCHACAAVWKTCKCGWFTFDGPDIDDELYEHPEVPDDPLYDEAWLDEERPASPLHHDRDFRDYF